MNEVDNERVQEESGLGIELLDHVAVFFGCDPDQEKIQRSIYRDTACGAWLVFTETGLRIGSIVEGMLDQAGPIDLVWTGVEDVQSWLSENIEIIEEEAAALWETSHCASCDSVLDIDDICEDCEIEQ